MQYHKILTHRASAVLGGKRQYKVNGRVVGMATAYELDDRGVGVRVR
jgi:hypothetical protein